MKLGAISVCLSVSLSSMAVADEEVVRRLSGYHFDDETWNYIPVHDPGTGLVDAIVAIAKPDATIGDNLNTVMFIRSGNEFEAWSWRNTTRGRAVYSAKMILGVSDEDDANWLLEEELPWLDDDALRPPTPYMAGMLTDDPLFEPVMESENPAALVSMLQEMGYPVAMLRPGDDGGESTPPCPDQAELRPMLESVEWALDQTVESESQSIAVLQQMAAYSANCTGGGCTPNTQWITGRIIPGGCAWEASSAPPELVGAVGGGLMYSCSYNLKRIFSQSRVKRKTLANCTTTSCNQSRTGFGYSSGGSCTFIVTFPLPTPVVCPGGPPCVLVAPPCASIAPSAWTPWAPLCP